MLGQAHVLQTPGYWDLHDARLQQQQLQNAALRGAQRQLVGTHVGTPHFSRPLDASATCRVQHGATHSKAHRLACATFSRSAPVKVAPTQEMRTMSVSSPGGSALIQSISSLKSFLPACQRSSARRSRCACAGQAALHATKHEVMLAEYMAYHRANEITAPCVRQLTQSTDDQQHQGNTPFIHVRRS